MDGRASRCSTPLFSLTLAPGVHVLNTGVIRSLRHNMALASIQKSITAGDSLKTLAMQLFLLALTVAVAGTMSTAHAFYIEADLVLMVPLPLLLSPLLLLLLLPPPLSVEASQAERATTINRANNHQTACLALSTKPPSQQCWSG